MSVSVFAPISVGNVSVGFDTLGLCLSPIDGALVGDIVTVAETSDSSDDFCLSGSHSHKLPQDKETNIVWRCLLAFNKALTQKALPLKTVKLTLEKNIPVSSGLGSSACSVVAAFVALNEFYRSPFNQNELLRLMGELEAEISGSLHYDNVAPCFLGGLQLMLNDPKNISQAIPTFEDCYWVIAYPDVVVSTKAAREILPTEYSRQTLIEFGQNLAGFIDASYRKDKQQAFKLIKDVVAEPYRKNLIPHFEQAQEKLMQSGALAVGISGSGPTLFTVADSVEKAQEFRDWLQLHYLQSSDGFVHICKVDNTGARVV